MILVQNIHLEKKNLDSNSWQFRQKFPLLFYFLTIAFVIERLTSNRNEICSSEPKLHFIFKIIEYLLEI